MIQVLSLKPRYSRCIRLKASENLTNIWVKLTFKLFCDTQSRSTASLVFELKISFARHELMVEIEIAEIYVENCYIIDRTVNRLTRERF